MSLLAVTWTAPVTPTSLATQGAPRGASVRLCWGPSFQDLTPCQVLQHRWDPTGSGAASSFPIPFLYMGLLQPPSQAPATP